MNRTTTIPCRKWQAEHAREQISERPIDNWLRYQAQSFLGRPVTIEEARELFSRIDVNTRQPIEHRKTPWWVKLLGA